MVFYLLNMFGVAVFAVSGALTAGRKSLDPFGVIVIVAIGGGTIRDLLLDNRPIFWIADPTYLVVIILAALATLVYARFRRPPRGSLFVADAFGLALFTVTGAQTAEAAGTSSLIVVLMGTITGVAGGILRDVLCAEIPLILRREIYATASIVGVCVYVLLNDLAPGSQAAVLVPMGLIFALRLAAIRLNLHVPPFESKDREV
jgi:uncharacterized membrane protein YeiH